jgi:2-polyprenyl-3-methyl-5-hydroxy-6-metoxy-1,4-benzoquinol methylase
MKKPIERKIVYKVEDDMDKSLIYCTVYQMRNFYAQFADGFFSSLDVMNYIQHHAAVLRMKKDWRVLDVCCGRGLLLPLLRYYRPEIKEYVGIDISEKNINEQLRRSGVKMIENAETYYPFKLTHQIGSVEDMDQFFKPNSFDFIVYTSAIEHMQKEVGYKSLQHCYSVLKPGQEMFLSCPNSSDKKDPYDTQYAAHIYEWGINELRNAVTEIGFEIPNEYGLVGKVRDFEKFVASKGGAMEKRYCALKEYLPTNWLMAFMPILYPEAAAEVLLIVKKPGKTKKLL